MNGHVVRLFSHSGTGIIVVFEPNCRYKIPEANLSAGALNTLNIWGRWENFYLRNGMRQAHSYYGTLIRSHR